MYFILIWKVLMHVFEVLLQRVMSFTPYRANLNARIHEWQQVVEKTPRGHPYRVKNISNLGLLLGERYSYTNNMADSEAAVALLKEAAETYPAGYSERATLLNLVAPLLGNKAALTGRTTDFETALRIMQDAVSATPADHPHHVESLKRLCLFAFLKCFKTEDRKFLGDAFLGLKGANGMMLLEGLGVYANDTHSHARDIAQLQETILILKQPIDEMPVKQQENIQVLIIFGVLLARRYIHSRKVDHLEEALHVTKRTVDALPLGHSLRVAFLNLLGFYLGEKYSHTGNIRDLEAAIGAYQETLHASSSLNDLYRAKVLSRLGRGVGAKYHLTQAPASMGLIAVQ